MLAAIGWIVAEEYHPFFGGEIGGPAFRHFQVRRWPCVGGAGPKGGAVAPLTRPPPRSRDRRRSRPSCRRCAPRGGAPAARRRRLGTRVHKVPRLRRPAAPQPGAGSAPHGPRRAHHRQLVARAQRRGAQRPRRARADAQRLPTSKLPTRDNDHATTTARALTRPARRAPQFWEFVILAIGICESVRISAGWNSLNAPATEQIKEDYEPGQIGFDPLGLFPEDADAAFEIQTKEINNGRLAMISIAGFAVQEEVDHITIWRGLVEENIVPAAEANLLPY